MPGQVTALIMAAGRGTRMRSTLPKVLHTVCGRTMIDWVVSAARAGGAERVVCVIRPGETVEDALPVGVELVEQLHGEGTGAAVLAARAALAPSETVVVMSGDHPLVSPQQVADLLATHRHERAAATLLTTDRLEPTGYGRIVRAADGAVERIVETKSVANVAPDELAIDEVNLGLYAFDARELPSALEAVAETDGERYLTGVFPVLRERGLKVAAHATDDASSALGVNTRADLIDVTRAAQQRILREHARAGVTFSAPDCVQIDADVEIGPDTTVLAGVTLLGATRIGGGCTIGPHTTVRDSVIGDGVMIPHSYLVDCLVAERATIGPFAYLRPQAELGERAKVGTFVEVKNSRIGAGAKVPHLSYIGDADVGEGANIGGGAITANYDGRAKHRTVVGRDAQTSVHTSFVAPVRVGDRAYTGAGSVITEDVPDGALGIARARQKNIEGYADRKTKDSE